MWRAEPLLAVALIAGPAPSAAGALTFTPAASIDTAAIRVTTPAGCPDRADTYHAIARGSGFPAEGQVVTAPTGAGISHRAGFDVYFAQTMKDFAADNRTTLSGRYDVSVYCSDGFTGQVFAEFTGAITFTTPTSWSSGPVAVGAAAGPPVSAPTVPPDPEAAPAAPASRSAPVAWIVAAIAALALAFETGRRYGRRTT